MQTNETGLTMALHAAWAESNSYATIAAQAKNGGTMTRIARRELRTIRTELQTALGLIEQDLATLKEVDA